MLFDQSNVVRRKGTGRWTRRSKRPESRSDSVGPDAAAALGHQASFFVVRALAWAAAFILIFAPLTVARFKRV
jgi:hypothetical protein